MRWPHFAFAFALRLHIELRIERKSPYHHISLTDIPSQCWPTSELDVMFFFLFSACELIRPVWNNFSNLLSLPIHSSSNQAKQLRVRSRKKKHMSKKEIDFWMGSVKKGKESWKSEFNNRQFPLFGIHQTKKETHEKCRDEFRWTSALLSQPCFLVCTHRASNWRIPTIGPVGLFMSESG